MFYNLQPQAQKDIYTSLLSCVGTLSRLFSDSNNPYLHYRAHEILFAHAFNAHDISRGDISFDATKQNIGLGLKTFLHGNGATYQKIAEFNSVSNEIRDIGDNPEEIIHFIANMRNQRLEDTLAITGVEQMLYHVITRETGQFNISELPMTPIVIDNISDITQINNNIHFKDRYYKYNFSLSKNTLLKKFDLSNSIIDSFPVTINPNPFETLQNLISPEALIDQNVINQSINHNGAPFIVLPLYSTKDGEVHERSGLNQWNARGRSRNPLEVYIPIPRWIHLQIPTFFGYNPDIDRQFNIKLPNCEIIPCKVCQGGGKALMSNPNKLLGDWLINQALRLPNETIITRDMLRKKDIDSVLLTKVDKETHEYEIDFLKYGSFEEFALNHKK